MWDKSNAALITIDALLNDSPPFELLLNYYILGG